MSGAISPLQTFAAAAIAATTGAVYGFIQYGDQLEKTAARTGITAEALSQLGYAAGQSGSNLESFQKGVTKMNQALFEAAKGSSEPVATFGQLGLTLGSVTGMSEAAKAEFSSLGKSVETLSGLSADEQFILIAERLSQVQDTGTRAALAMKIFGKGAVDLLPLINGGADGIQQLRDEAEALGVTFSTKAAGDAAKLGDALDRLFTASKNVAYQVGAVLAPIITGIANTMAYAVGANQDWLRTVLVMGSAIAGAVIAFKAITLAQQAYAKAAAIAQALSGPTGWATLAASVAVAAAATYALTTSFDDANAAAADQQKGLADSAAAYTQMDATVGQATVAFKSYKAETDSLAASYNSLVIPKTVQLRNELNKMTADWYAAGEAGQAVGVTWTQLEQLKLAKVLDVSGWKDSFTAVTDELRILRGEITETELKFAKMAENGVDEQRIAKLREAYAERDKLTKANEASQQNDSDTKKRQEDKLAKVTNTRDEVLKSFITPVNEQLSEFRSKSDEVKAAIAAGILDPAKGLAYLQIEQAKLLGDSQGAAVAEYQAKAAEIQAAIGAGKLDPEKASAVLKSEQSRLLGDGQDAALSAFQSKADMIRKAVDAGKMDAIAKYDRKVDAIENDVSKGRISRYSADEKIAAEKSKLDEKQYNNAQKGFTSLANAQSKILGDGNSKGLDEFKKQVAETQAQVASGKLDAAKGFAFLQAAEASLIADSGKPKSEGEPATKVVANDARGARSAAANQQLVGLLNRGNKLDPAAKTNALQVATNSILNDIKTELAGNKLQTKRFGGKA